MRKKPAKISVDDSEIHIVFIRAPGPGGQNVNKVATAVQLRFNVLQSASFSEPVRARLIALLGPKVASNGDLIIKATRFRTQERNKQDALQRLDEYIQRAAIAPKKRKKTKPTWAAKQRRLDTKTRHGKIKSLRRKNSME